MIILENEYKKANLIMDIVKDKTKIDPLNNPHCRIKKLSDTRTLSIYMMRKYTKLSFQQIGLMWETKNYKGKNHATILHNTRKAEILMDSKFGDINFIRMHAVCKYEYNKLLPILKFDKVVEEDSILELKLFNAKLVQREIYRKAQVIDILNAIRYIPDAHRKRIEKKLQLCLTHS